MNLLKAISHEMTQHAMNKAADYKDDGNINRSYLPKDFRKFGTHSDYYFISRKAISTPENPIVRRFTIDTFNILKKGSKHWNLYLSDTKIKEIMWSFKVSLINLQKNGKLQSIK